MDDDNRRGKEYYQVNLDTGRIFWIAFVLGLVLIAIFIFGFLIGGEDRERPLRFAELDLFGRGEEEGRPPGREAAEGPPADGSGKAPAGETGAQDGGGRPRSKDGDRLSEIFETDLETETRYIEVESIDEAIRESEQKRPREHREPEKEQLPAGERDKPGAAAPDRAFAPKKPGPAARVEGIYYIQVASFVKEENARALAEKLRKNLYKVTIEQAVVDGATFHRVRVGPFEQRSVAANTMAAMKRRFNLKDPFVVAKRT